MSKKVKLYLPEEYHVKVMEFEKEDKQKVLDTMGFYETYDEAKERLDFVNDVKEVTSCNCRSDIEDTKKAISELSEEITRIGDLHSEEIARINRKINGKGIRIDSLSDKIDYLKNQSKKGQDMLLDRIKEIDSDLKEQIKRTDKNVKVGNIGIDRIEKLRRKTKSNSKWIRNICISVFLNVSLTLYLAYLLLVN